MATEAVTEKRTGLYGAARAFAWFLFRVLMPVRYHGAEKLREREGSFVVISNHLHALDPLILAKPVKAQCVFLGKKEQTITMIKVLFICHCSLFVQYI